MLFDVKKGLYNAPFLGPLFIEMGTTLERETNLRKKLLWRSSVEQLSISTCSVARAWRTLYCRIALSLERGAHFNDFASVFQAAFKRSPRRWCGFLGSSLGAFLGHFFFLFASVFQAVFKRSPRGWCGFLVSSLGPFWDTVSFHFASVFHLLWEPF